MENTFELQEQTTFSQNLSQILENETLFEIEEEIRSEKEKDIPNDNRYEELQKKQQQEALTTLQNTRDYIFKRINWETFIEEYEDLEENCYLVETLINLNSITSQENTNSAHTFYKEFKEIIPLFEQYNCFENEALRETLRPADPKRKKKLSNRHESLANILEKNTALKASFRGFFYATEKGLLQTLPYFINQDPDFLDAYEKFLNKMTFEVRREQKLGLTGKTRYKVLKETNNEELVENLKLFNTPKGFEPEVVRELIRRFIPTHFIKKLEYISFQEKAIEVPLSMQIENGDEKKWVTVGGFFPIYDGKNNLSTASIKAMINTADPKTLEEFTDLWKIFHEFGHLIHTQLNYKEMLEWKALVDSGITNISDYTKRIRKEEIDKKYSEDFAENFALFSIKPNLFLEKYQETFEYFFFRIMKKYMNEDQFKLLKASLRKLDEIHEKNPNNEFLILLEDIRRTKTSEV